MLEKVEIIQNQIQFYELVFKICLAGVFIFTILTIYIYFALHIGKVISRITGIYRKKEIVRIHQNNMLSGQVMGIYEHKKMSIYQYDEQKTEKLYPMSEETVLLVTEDKTQLLSDTDFEMTETVLLGQAEEWI